MTVGMDGLVLSSPRGEFLLRIELSEPPQGPAETRVMVPPGVFTSLSDATQEPPVMAEPGARVTVVAGAEEARPGAGVLGEGAADQQNEPDLGGRTEGQAGYTNRQMPWREDYVGPPGLARVSASLRMPHNLGPELWPVPGGGQTATLIPMGNGEVELLEITRTRFKDTTAARMCERCGRPWPTPPGSPRPGDEDDQPGGGGLGAGGTGQVGGEGDQGGNYAS